MAVMRKSLRHAPTLSYAKQPLTLACCAGCVGVAGIAKEGCGLHFTVRLNKPMPEATLSYKFKFSENYDWTFGGKMPGMCDEGVASRAWA